MIPVRTGLLFALLTITGLHFLPRMLSWWPIVSCSVDATAAGWCVNQYTWLAYPQMFIYALALFAVPCAFGLVLAIQHQRHATIHRRAMQETFMGLLVYLAAILAFELLWLKPWTLQRLPSGVTYNAFMHDSYVWSWALALIVFMFMFGYGCTRFVLIVRTTKKTAEIQT